MRTISYKDWLKLRARMTRTSSFIVAHFDVVRLKRRKKSPGRARNVRRRPPRSS